MTSSRTYTRDAAFVWMGLAAVGLASPPCSSARLKFDHETLAVTLEAEFFVEGVGALEADVG